MRIKGNDSSVGIRAVKAFRSELFLLKKGCRQVSLVQGGSQRTKTGNMKSSSENYNNPSNNALNVNVNNGNVNNWNKNNSNCYVRAVLAFLV